MRQLAVAFVSGAMTVLAALGLLAIIGGRLGDGGYR